MKQKQGLMKHYLDIITQFLENKWKDLFVFNQVKLYNMVNKNYLTDKT